MGIVAVFILFVGFAIVVRLIAGSMDGDRVGAYIRSRGGRLLSKEWAPFGRGWAGEKDSRIYRVTYQDAEGAIHEATCKTSAFSGVYFTDDRIVRHSPQARHSGGARAQARTGTVDVEPSRAAAVDEDVATRLRRLDQLRAENLITPEEHAEQRSRILNRL